MLAGKYDTLDDFPFSQKLAKVFDWEEDETVAIYANYTQVRGYLHKKKLT